jgi:hypothetical protein
MTFRQCFTNNFGEIAMTNTQHTNENLTLHFKVKDFDAWRTGYNGNGSADDPNEVVVLQDVADVVKARTWFGSDDLKATMQKSGVIGSPSIRFAA